MTHNPAEIRNLLKAVFNDEDFTQFCYYHFKEKVYAKFSDKMTLTSKIHLLIEHCDRHEEFDKLLRLVKKENPTKYEKFFPSSSPRPDVDSSDIREEIPPSDKIQDDPQDDDQPIPGNKPMELPTIGIITALPKEYAAMDALLENAINYTAQGQGAGRRYRIGEIPSKDGGRHVVALSLAGMGTNTASHRAARLLGHFPSVSSIVMVGIAGGVPYPHKVDDHVRLGDVVVSNEGGVIQYDMDKEEIDRTIHRHPPRPPSAFLLEGVKLLEATELISKSQPWMKFIEEAGTTLKVRRPPAKTDVLVSSTNPERKISHPKDPKRRRGKPRIFMGTIASANKLLKNPQKRDALRDKFHVKAVEMEASGIADATWDQDKGYLVVRGICDYCDVRKNDIWQGYAAIVAAAYTRALLESMPVSSDHELLSTT